MKSAIRYLTQFVFAVGTAALFFGCGKNGNGNNANQINSVCPAGTQVYQNGICYDSFGRPLTSNMDQGYGVGYISTNFQTSYNPPTMRLSGMGSLAFLREAMGVCDRGGYNQGIYSCNSWMSGFMQMVLQAPPSPTAETATLTVWGYPRTNEYYWYGIQLPSITDFLKGMIGWPVISDLGAYRNPLSLNMVVSLVNKSQGFEGRGYGAYDTTANIGLLQLSVPNGQITQDTFNYTLFYKGQGVANGTFVRCQNSQCR